MPLLKSFIRQAARRLGYEVVHRSTHPVLQEQLTLYNALRFAGADSLDWDDKPPQIAAQAHLQHLLQRKRIDLVFDVGANEGQFARQLRGLGYTGDIVSFEPAPHMVAQLQQAARSDPHWKIVPSAVGHARERLTLHVAVASVFSSFHPPNDYARKRFGDMVTTDTAVAVDVLPLDEVWRDLAGPLPRRILLKTDTQGHDLEVLGGASSLLPHTAVLISEASFRAIHEHTPDFGVLTRFAEQAGFQITGIFPISHDAESLGLIEADVYWTRR